MSILLVEVPTGSVSVDLARFADKNTMVVYEHLLHYFRKFEPLPAISIQIEGDSVIVVRGHAYLAAARDLGRPTVRAVVASSPTSPDTIAYLRRQDVRRLDLGAIRAAEDAEPAPRGWHVFFFERHLTLQEKEAFDARVARLFASVEPTAIRVHHDDDLKLAEFEARTPGGDHAWATDHLVTFAGFSREVVRIVSFQGGQFNFGSPSTGAQSGRG